MVKPKIIQMDQIQLQIVLLFKQGRAQTQPHKQGMIQMSKVGNLRSHLVSLHNLQQIEIEIIPLRIKMFTNKVYIA